MRFASLGSGSKGNALVVESGATRILVDCGFGPRELTTRLGRLGLTPSDVDAVVVTHEHSDHIGGVASCARRFDFDVYLSYGTCVAGALEGRVKTSCFDSLTPFAINDLEVHPFPVPHDAREPTQFVIGDGLFRLGILTDAGSVTPHMVAMLDGCHGLVLECNHDQEMLRSGKYPESLKQRISGRLGHLDNEAAAALLARIERTNLQHIVAAHLSEQNNRPELAEAALARVLGCKPAEVPIADQENGCGWRVIR